MYPGTIAMKHAAKSPAPGDHNSLVKKYVDIAVKPLKKRPVINYFMNF